MTTISQTTRATAQNRQIISAVLRGVRSKVLFEELTEEILSNVSHKLLLVEDFDERKAAVEAYLRELEDAKLIGRFHLSYEQPTFNRQVNAAITHIISQLKVKYTRYITA